MKYWVWLILLSAGGATAYLIYSPGSSTGPEPKSHHEEPASQNTELEQEDRPPIAIRGGEATETILPEDALTRPSKSKASAKKAVDEAGEDQDQDGARHPEDGEEAELRDRDEDLRHERDLALGPIPNTSRRSRPRKADSVNTPPPAVPSPASDVVSLGSTSPAAVTAATASPGAASAPVLGGTFPALPASATASAASSGSASVSSGSSSSSSRSTFAPSAPSAPSSNTSSSSSTILKGKPEETTVADAKRILPPSNPLTGPPPTGNDVLIKPIIALPEKPGAPPENPENAESVWMETMRIPAGFSGLAVTPGTIAAVSPNAANAAENEWLLGATWKSNFEPGDKPTLQILRDCSDPAVSDCDVHLPQGGPSVINYIFQNGPHAEDMIPDTKDFEIGTVTLGSQKDGPGKEAPVVEAAFHINPGVVPGRYTVSLFAKDRKLTANFEVVATTTPAATATTQPATQPTTQPAGEPMIRSYIAPSKAPVPK